MECVNPHKSGARDYLLCLGSLLTLSFLRPFFLRADNTFLPLAVAILLLNPCLLLLFLLLG